MCAETANESSSATAERGAVAAGWSEEKAHELPKEERPDETGPSQK